jgi:hypothetical protein
MSDKKDGNWLKTIHDCCDSLNENSYDMLEIAGALRRVGMTDLADEINMYAQCSQNCAAAINRATGQACAEAANRATQSSINVLTASLAGLAIGSDDPETIETAKKLAGVE